MEIEYFGANCFRIKTSKVTIVVDDNLGKLGGKTIQNEKTTAFYTNRGLLDENASKKSRLVVESPGEFEVGDVTVTGIQARAHTDEEGFATATVYQFMLDGQTITVLGHVHPEISDEVIERAGGTDVLIVPIGGSGFTLDSIGAASIIKKVEPSVVIPSQYAVKGLNYDVPAQTLEEFGKASAFNLEEPKTSHKVAKTGVTEDSAAIVVEVLEVASK